MIRLTIAILMVLLPWKVTAKEIKYKVADIPKELKENARSVVRNEEIVFEVTSISSGKLTVTYAITVLNKNGLDDAYFREFYDKFTKISNIKGRVYNENGELVKKLSGDDIIDHSAISGYTAYDDNRVKFIDPKNRTIPFTVEYSYETSYNGLFIFPSWYPQSKYNFSVEKSSYKAFVRKDMSFRYLEKNVPSKVTITSDENFNIYYWEGRNMKALAREPFNYGFQEVFPYVMAAPTEFEIENYKGDLTSWENFGKWISKLNEGKNILSDEIKGELQKLVATADNDFDKVKKIYEFMQGKTRYVSIQVGIGGWQPFDASTVHRLSYGDCKALSNYMKSMLDAIGVKSNYCLVNAEEYAQPMIKDFPSSQFNHAFLCVPLKEDTLWLECTSQRFPCGYIGDFTDDRDVLLIDNDNSKIVHTKVYSMQENKETHVCHVEFNQVGGGKASIHTNYYGLKYNDGLRIFLDDNTDKKRLLANKISLPNFDITSFNFKECKQMIPSIDETVELTFSNFGTVMGNRVFMPLNFGNKLTDIPERVRNRTTDVYVRRPSMEVDTVIYSLPVGYKIESMPKPVNIKTEFGTYQASAEAKGKQIIYIRTFQLNKGKYPPTAYTDFIDFFDKVSTADEMQCSLAREL